MDYKSILVLLEHDGQCHARVRHATMLARQLECRLVGLVPTGLIDLPSVSYAAASLAELAGRAWDALRDQAEHTAERFRDDCHAAGLTSFEVIVEESEKTASLIRWANSSDLVVLSQAEHGLPEYRAANAVVEATILNVARPTLLLPYVRSPDTFGQRVMVCWDGSREAARATSDAMPLLRRAKEVRVASWSEANDVNGSQTEYKLDEICRWLSLHGVTAVPQKESTQAPIGEAILSRAADWSTDLIVMGAYGHARWAERMLGGATRGLLQAMTVPVLMSH